jgi:hypothetical protein
VTALQQRGNVLIASVTLPASDRVALHACSEDEDREVTLNRDSGVEPDDTHQPLAPALHGRRA